MNLASEKSDRSYAISCLKLVQDRLRKLSEFNDLTSFFFEKPSASDSQISKFTGDLEKSKEILKEFYNLYSDPDFGAWEKSNLDLKSHSLLAKMSLKPKEAFMTLRVALTSKEATPPLFDVAEVMGKNVVLERLKEYI